MKITIEIGDDPVNNNCTSCVSDFGNSSWELTQTPANECQWRTGFDEGEVCEELDGFTITLTEKNATTNLWTLTLDNASSGIEAQWEIEVTKDSGEDSIDCQTGNLFTYVSGLQAECSGWDAVSVNISGTSCV